MYVLEPVKWVRDALHVIADMYKNIFFLWLEKPFALFVVNKYVLV